MPANTMFSAQVWDSVTGQWVILGTFDEAVDAANRLADCADMAPDWLRIVRADETIITPVYV